MFREKFHDSFGENRRGAFLARLHRQKLAVCPLSGGKKFAPFRRAHRARDERCARKRKRYSVFTAEQEAASLHSSRSIASNLAFLHSRYDKENFLLNRVGEGGGEVDARFGCRAKQARAHLRRRSHVLARSLTSGIPRGTESMRTCKELHLPVARRSGTRRGGADLRRGR